MVGTTFGSHRGVPAALGVATVVAGVAIPALLPLMLPGLP